MQLCCKVGVIFAILNAVYKSEGRSENFSPKRDLKSDLCDTGSVSKFLRVISCYSLFRVSKTTVIPSISSFNLQFKFMRFPHNVRRAVEVYLSLNKTISKVLITNSHTNSPNCNGITPISELSTFRTVIK